MYHSVSHFPPERDIPYDNVPPALFKAHMRILKQEKFHVISLSQLVSLMRDNEPIPPKTIVVTFDDGYKNNIMNAFPILQEEGYNATFFLIAGAIGTHQPFRHALWDTASRNYQRKNPDSRNPMHWDDVRELAAGGNDIGSHGVTHRSLGHLACEESSVEIFQSKEMIEKATNTPVRSFSYPFGSCVYGDFNVSSERLIASAGYECACTTEIGPVAKNDYPYQLKRIPVREKDTWFFFKQKLMGTYDWVNMGKRFFQQRFPRIDKDS